VRILVTTNAAVGHLLPMASTIAALTAGGHEVLVGCPASFAPFVRRGGFEPLPGDEIEVRNSVPDPPPQHDARLTWAVTLSWPSDCRPWVDSLLQQARRWRPDVVIVEPVEHAGRVVAAALGLPLVVHGWGFTLPSSVEAAASAGIRDLYDRVRAVPPEPSLVADLGPASVQADDCGPARRYRYRPFPLPGAPLPPPPTTKPRVLVTLGTYPNPDAAAGLRTAVAAALDHGADVIAVLGHQDRGARDTFPAGATVQEWVDMPAAIRDSDVVVHHGGAGTSWTALSCGKPAVVLPQAGDQFRNAQLLSAAGAAVVSSTSDAGELADVVAQALDDANLAERAAAIARDNAALPDIAELAHDIAALA